MRLFPHSNSEIPSYSKPSTVKYRIAANFVIFLDVSEFFKKIGFLGIFGPPSYGMGATIRIGREMLCLPYAGFFLIRLCRLPFLALPGSAKYYRSQLTENSTNSGLSADRFVRSPW